MHLAPAILAEMIRALNAFQKKGQEKFSKSALLLYIWVQSHFWGEKVDKVKPYFPYFVPLSEFIKEEWPKSRAKK